MKNLLGQRVKDIVTGFEGITTAQVIYLNGCIQYCVKPKVGGDGKMREGEYIDEGQLVVLEKGTVCLDQKENGGVMADEPPKNYNG